MSDCNPFGQGINIRPRSNVKIYAINQTQVFTHILASTFLTTSSPYIFSFYYEFLGIPRVNLGKFSSSREYLLAVTSGRIAVVGTKVFELSPLSIVRSNWLARLNVESGISPLCLQIYFCTNTSFGTLGGIEIQYQDQHVEH